MGCVTHVSTSSELKIASNLSQARAKIFLETRYYMRDALSALFDINPMKVPITAHPGKPPELPNGMGYISISHCKDAFIIGWHQENIGIDIERSDRDFNESLETPTISAFSFKKSLWLSLKSCPSKVHPGVLSLG